MKKKSIIHKQVLLEGTGQKPPVDYWQDCKDLYYPTKTWGIPPQNSLNGILDGLNLMDIIKTGAATYVQVEQAKNGQPVYVNTPQGGKQDIGPILMSKLEQQAQQQQTSVNNMMQMLQMQMQANQNQQKPKDNTMLYVGIGVAALVVIGGAFILTKKK